VAVAPTPSTPAAAAAIAAEANALSRKAAAIAAGAGSKEIRSRGSEIEDAAKALRRAGKAASRIAVLGAASGVDTGRTALKLARALAKNARVVLVELENSSAGAASSDPSANGLAELAAGAASFRDIITKDRSSTLHLISAGRQPSDRTKLLSSPNMEANFDALARSYNNVVVDAGVIAGPELQAVAELAPQAVLVATALSDADKASARERLIFAGFDDVTFLTGARERGVKAA
jgi:Mrp family chromosome partitioning ATPase